MKRSIIAFLGVLILVGCESTAPDDPVDLSFHNTSWTTTSIGEFEAIGVHEDGSLLAIDSTPGTDYDGRIVFRRSPDASPFFIWGNPSGLPTLAYMEDNFWIFDNWTNTTVDLGIIRSNGAIEIIKGIGLPTSAQAVYGFSPFSSQTSAFSAASLATIMRWAGHVASVAACVITAPSALTPAALLWGLGCSVTIVSIANDIMDSEDAAAKASYAALGSFLSAVGCINKNVASCVSWMTNAAAAVVTAAETDKVAKSTIIETTRSTMNAQALFTENFETSTIGAVPTG